MSCTQEAKIRTIARGLHSLAEISHSRMFGACRNSHNAYMSIFKIDDVITSIRTNVRGWQVINSDTNIEETTQ